MKKNKNISEKTQADLSRAYMGVYNAFVDVYQSRGFARAQSQFNAIRIMHEIMMAHKDTADNPAIKFLNELYNTHSKIIAKKTMLSPDKDKIEPVSVADGGANVLQAINNFESAIAAVGPNVLCILKKVSNICNFSAQKKPGINFSSWLDISVSDADITKLENDPRYFGTLYHRYVMRQSHR